MGFNLQLFQNWCTLCILEMGLATKLDEPDFVIDGFQPKTAATRGHKRSVPPVQLNFGVLSNEKAGNFFLD